MSSLFPEFYVRILDGLIEARKKAAVALTDLAKSLGRPQSFVAKYQGRERRLDVAEFIGIARKLGVDPYQLLRGAEPAESSNGQNPGRVRCTSPGEPCGPSL